MEHSSKNENKLSVTCDIFMKEVVMEEHNVKEQFEINPSLESEIGGNLQIDNEKKIMQQHFKKLHIQRKFWKPKGRNALCWSFFCINDNKLVNLEQPQIRRCLLCYNALMNVSNRKMQARKGLISYYKTNGITSLKKTCGW